MKISYLFFLVVFLLNFFIPNDALAVKNEGLDSIVTGIDVNGNESSCLRMVQPLYCSMEIQVGDLHGLDCRSRGFKAVQCGCHNFVCVEYETETVVGVDRQGMKRSCRPMKEGASCTEIFTEDEAFAERCQEKGGVAVACGCHDYICVKN
ncbi:hypothetical protein BALOs_0982 [Halobacteriovorax sp. BALOs_7]|uniref:hypothetical protein n=1 Tax=unclassified Halobacteriovorax TaxID=2639665 RepID=UPI000EA1DE91|nr:hypothetical protein [Halobacteriovorax sp. BALOs_7]AYF43992.1 hypothetical protein BALOs_0982 [Halobacteriovorax sp. BALOs_7]